MHFSTLHGHWYTTVLLIREGANIYLENDDEKTALDVAKNDAIKKTITQYEDIKISGYVKNFMTHDIPSAIVSLLLTFTLGKKSLTYLQG